jgi:hypothetical protein
MTERAGDRVEFVSFEEAAAASAFDTQKRFVTEISAALKELAELERRMLGATDHARAVLNTFTHALRADPAQRWGVACRSADAMADQLRRLHALSASLSRGIVDTVCAPLDRLADGDIAAAERARRTFALARETVLSPRSPVQLRETRDKCADIGSAAVREMTTVNDGINAVALSSFSSLCGVLRATFAEGLECVDMAEQRLRGELLGDANDAAAGSEADPGREVLRALMDLEHVAIHETDIVMSAASMGLVQRSVAAVAFGDIESLFSLHTKMLVSIETGIKAGKQSRDIVADVFLSYTPALEKLYIPFVKSHGRAVAILEAAKSTAPPKQQQLAEQVLYSRG